MIKVGLVQINNSYPNSFYLPYSVGILQAYFQRYAQHPEAFEFLKPVFSKIPVAQIVSHLEQAEIIAFSVYGWNFNISLEVAKKIKRKNPDVLIIFGGAHVPDDENILRKYPFIDITCYGEGEGIFLEILKNYPSRSWERVPAIIYRDNGYIKNQSIPRIADVSDIPSPYLDGMFDKIMCDNSHYQWMVLWETNRGCPYSCAFCDWGAYTKSKIYAFDMERIEKEINWFAEKKIEFIYCCDANFGILKRDVEIAKRIVEAKKKTGFPKFLSIHDTKNLGENTYNIQKMLFENGLSKGVSLAVQSLDKTTLKNIGRYNTPPEKFEYLQRKFNRNNIETYTEFLQGLPSETYESMVEGISNVIKMGQYSRIRVGILSVLPNSQVGNPDYQKKYGLEIIESKNVSQHSSANDELEDTQRLVVATKAMPKHDWIKGRVFTYWCTLLYSDKILQIPLLILQNQYTYKELFEAFFIEDSKYPITTEIYRIFTKRAKSIQDGEGEFPKAKEWLNLYWPPDEYVFIKLIYEDKLNQFYREAKKILSRYFVKKDVLDDAIMLNRNLIKKPFQKENLRLRIRYNIWELYRAILDGEEMDLIKGQYIYNIDRTSETWDSWDNWLREVVWYCNRQGKYLYGGVERYTKKVICPKCGGINLSVSNVFNLKHPEYRHYDCKKCVHDWVE